MSNLRQAAQQALDAWDNPMGMKDLCVAMDAIRTALEQQSEALQAEALQAMNDQLTTGTSIMLDGKRVDPASVYKQAEPVAWMDREGDLYKMPEIENWSPPHTMLYTTPPQRQWDRPSASFNEWWNGDYDDAANPFEKDSAAYWAWAGWKAAQRQWQGLTDEDWEQIADMPDTFDQGVAWAQARLKEKNDLHKD